MPGRPPPKPKEKNERKGGQNKLPKWAKRTCQTQHTLRILPRRRSNRTTHKRI